MKNQIFADWQEMKLSEIATISRGGSPRPIEDFITEDIDGLNWLRIGDIDPGAKYVTRTAQKIKISGLSKTTLVKSGDFILSNSMSFGRPYIMKIDACIHDGWLSFKDIKTHLVVKEFLYYLLTSEKLQNIFKSVAAGSGVKNLKRESVSNISVSLPSLKEQQKIAEILSSIDQDIVSTQQIILKTELLKRSTFSEILKKQHTWKSVKLGNIAEFKNGINFSKDQKGNEGIPTLDVLNMYSPSIFVDTENLYKIRVENGKYQDYLLKPGDILFVRSSVKKEGIGWTSLFDKNDDQVLFCGFIIRARLTDKTISPQFLTHYLRFESLRQKIIASAGQSAITNISQSSLQNLTVHIPSEDEQRKIVELLSCFDIKLQNETKAKASLEKLKAGLMDDIFNQRVQIKA